MAAESRNRYSTVSLWLHWATALFVVLNIGLGMLMGAPKGGSPAFEAHKGVGVIVLGLTVFRLGWRLAHPWPPLPEPMAAWEKLFARGTHVAFYALLLAIPLLGWATVSAFAPEGAITLFGGVPWFQLPIANSRETGGALGDAHGALVWAAAALIALHVAGAVKNTYQDRLGVLARMIPGMRDPDADNAVTRPPRG